MNNLTKVKTVPVDRMGRVLKEKAFWKVPSTCERTADSILTNLLKPTALKNRALMLFSFGAIITTGLSMAKLPPNIPFGFTKLSAFTQLTG